MKNLVQRLPKAQYDDVLDQIEHKNKLPIEAGSFNPQEPDADGAGKNLHRNLSLQNLPSRSKNGVIVGAGGEGGPAIIDLSNASRIHPQLPKDSSEIISAQ